MFSPESSVVDTTDLTRVRRAASAARKAISGGERERAVASLCARLRRLITEAAALHVGSYRAMGTEADPAAATAALAGAQLYLPKVVGSERPLRFVAANSHTRFERSPLGIAEPEGPATISAAALQILLIPLLAFDRLGTRVGYGGGYYDRSLAECDAQSPLRVGVAFACQEQPPLSRQPWDQPLHLIATEKELIECPKIEPQPNIGC